MTYELTNEQQGIFPVDTYVAIQDLAQGMLAGMSPVETGAYRKGFFNGLLFQGNRVAPDIHTAVTDLLAEDSRIRQTFMAGNQKCYYWSPHSSSPEERIVDHLRDQTIPEAVDVLYHQFGTSEFPLRYMARVVSQLMKADIVPSGSSAPIQPWESIKLFTKAQERVTSRELVTRGTLLLKIAPPNQTS